MDLGLILNYVYELAYFLGTFALFFLVAVFRGRQAIINVIFGLYLALLISLEFPYYNLILGDSTDPHTVAISKLIFFAVITFLSTLLFRRVMPNEFRETRFESFGKKILLTLSATSLVMAFSFHALPITEFLSPGMPIQSLFSPESFFFGWLLLPLILLYVL